MMWHMFGTPYRPVHRPYMWLVDAYNLTLVAIHTSSARYCSGRWCVGGFKEVV